VPCPHSAWLNPMETAYGSPFCRYVVAEVSVTVGWARVPLIVTTVEPEVPTVYWEGLGEMETTM